MKNTKIKIAKDLPRENFKMNCEKDFRNEWFILSEFKKLGWFIMRNTSYYLELVKDSFIIGIDKENRTYAAKYSEGENSYIAFFDMEEHKLLHELFDLWGWLQ